MSKTTVRIPDRFDPTSACWEGEIESTGNTARDLGRAALEALKSGAYLSGAYLSGAYLSGAYLSGADLSGADLSGADLSRAYLSRADLPRADLSGAYLSGADLSGAYLSRADLFRADLSGAYLSGADLSGADLSRANLSGAYLSRANLSGANLFRAEDAELVIARTRILPEGSLIGWKKLQDGILAKLRIPEGAKRSHAFGRKCRAEFAEVLELLNPDGSNAPAGFSDHDPSFIYKVGDVVRPKQGFSEDWMEECAPGVHFYTSKIEAENH